jgi:uncharacterized CHY-type Zn-finger protein
MSKLCDMCGSDKYDDKYTDWIVFEDYHPWGIQKHYVCSDRCKKNFETAHPMIEYVQIGSCEFCRHGINDRINLTQKEVRRLDKAIKDFMYLTNSRLSKLEGGT